MKLHAVKFGVAFGIVYAAVFVLYGAAAALFGWGAEFIKLIGDIYAGIGPTFLGVLAGAIWGIVIGFLFGGAVAWIYNALLD
ncbi:MAG: hypothetical protein ACE5JJ_07465 [Nitrospinota bacterium]